MENIKEEKVSTNEAENKKNKKGKNGFHIAAIAISAACLVACGISIAINANIKRGPAGEQGISGEVGPRGVDGKDGVSVVSITKTSSLESMDTYTILYSDGTTSTFVIANGIDGIQGLPGEDGHTPVISIGTNGNWYVDGVDTNIPATGSKGDQGDKGDKGDKGDDGVTYIPCIFNNYDGTKLFEFYYEKGTEVVYEGPTPVKSYGYIFSGWDKPLENIQKPTIFTAQYELDYKGFNFYMEETEDAYVVTGPKTKSISNLKLPTVDDGKEIRVKEAAFRECEKLTSVELGDSVTTIEPNSFTNCYSLTEINLGNSLKVIGEDAFCNTGLLSVILPNSMEVIGYRAFAQCESMRSITIPNSVNTIYESAFGWCESLESIFIPASVTTITGSIFNPAGTADFIIYCEVEEKPSGWDEKWNDWNKPVVWGYHL